MINKFCIRIRA